MSGKYSKVQNNRKPRKPNRGKVIALILCAVAMCAVLVFVFVRFQQPQNDLTAANDGQQETESLLEQAQLETNPDMFFDLNHNLRIDKVGSYTGAYMEDGSDEVVGGVAMIVVTNVGEEYIQYAEITLTGDVGEAFFTFSSLFPGESMVVLDQNRTAYTDLSGEIGVQLNNVAVFSEAPNLCEDKLELQALDGALNVTNISGEDIEGDIVIYYKNSVADMFYGGITYRVRITGGMKAGEIKQIMSGHFSDSGSIVVFVTCG